MLQQGDCELLPAWSLCDIMLSLTTLKCLPVTLIDQSPFLLFLFYADECILNVLAGLGHIKQLADSEGVIHVCEKMRSWLEHHTCQSTREYTYEDALEETLCGLQHIIQLTTVDCEGVIHALQKVLILLQHFSQLTTIDSGDVIHAMEKVLNWLQHLSQLTTVDCEDVMYAWEMVMNFVDVLAQLPAGVSDDVMPALEKLLSLLKLLAQLTSGDSENELDKLKKHFELNLGDFEKEALKKQFKLLEEWMVALKNHSKLPKDGKDALKKNFKLLKLVKDIVVPTQDNSREKWLHKILSSYVLAELVETAACMDKTSVVKGCILLPAFLYACALEVAESGMNSLPELNGNENR